MEQMQVRIGVQGRLSESTARTLGGWIDDGDDGFELVVPFIDQSQVTGLLLRLDDLHIAFRHVTLPRRDAPSPAAGRVTDHPDTRGTPS